MKKSWIILSIVVMMVSVQATIIKEETPGAAALGKQLFFDPILSKDSTISCASCHKPQYAFADNLRVSVGVGGRKGKRNTPTAMNLLLDEKFFWDGRARSLEEQALAPIENPDEMNLPLAKAIERLNSSAAYKEKFMHVFAEVPSKSNLALAIASFERTLETSDSPFDNWKFSDDSSLVSDAVRRGFVLFNEKGKCIKCHFGSDFTTNDFKNIGLFNGKKLNDSGRAVVSGKAEDIGRFKTAGLRNVELTAPYMHNGMLKTLDDVIEFYNDPKKKVPNAINTDTILLKPLGLTKGEKNDLKAFLLSLTDKRFKTKS